VQVLFFTDKQYAQSQIFRGHAKPINPQKNLANWSFFDDKNASFFNKNQRKDLTQQNVTQQNVTQGLS